MIIGAPKKLPACKEGYPARPAGWELLVTAARRIGRAVGGMGGQKDGSLVEPQEACLASRV